MPAVYAFESLIGRKLAVTRHYPNWDYPGIPNDVIRESRRTGHIPLIAWRPQRQDNTWILWRDIANGLHDAEIDQTAANIKNWNRSAYFVFHHEPENAYRNHFQGTPGDPVASGAEFQAAYAHIKQRFLSVGAVKMKWVATLQRPTYDGSIGGSSAWFPLGSADLVGVDGYNRGACSGDKTWRSFATLFGSARAFAAAHGIKMVVEEWGCVPTDACGGGVSTQTKAQWLTAAGLTIKSWPQLKVVMYTHSLADFRGSPVDFRVNSDPDSLTAYKAIGNDPYFGGTGPPIS